MSAVKPWLVIGLGNPGAKYQHNRHNVGQMVLDHLAGQGAERFSVHRTNSTVAEMRLGTMPGGMPGPKVILAKPSSFMNVSGGPVSALVKYYSVSPDRILVVHDELDLPAHTLRLKHGGGEGGHNGLRSISQSLGTKNYARLRVGVGRPPGRMDTAAFVLSDFPRSESEEWALTIGLAADTVTSLVMDGFESTQMNLHSNS